MTLNYDAELAATMDSNCPWIKKSPDLVPTINRKGRMSQKSLNFSNRLWGSLHLIAQRQGFTNFSEFVRGVVELVFENFPCDADRTNTNTTINFSAKQLDLLDKSRGFFCSQSEQVRFAAIVYLMKYGEIHHE